MKSMLFSLILMLCSGAVSAAEAVASVILSFGENVAVAADGSERVLKRHSDIYANDLLKTGPGGRLQLRFSDNSRLALKAATEFRIAEYQFEQKKPEEGKALFQLLKGGMRTISGQIGKPNKDNYRLETTVATIGIRGTHYGVEYTDKGIYCETVEGAIQVTNDHQTILVSAGEGAWWGTNGDVRKGNATGQTGDYILRKKVHSDALTSNEQNEESEEDNKLAGTIPATDPELEGDYSDDGRSGQPELPDPTGNSSRAPDGALVAVAFTRDDKAKGYLSGNGSVVAGSASAIAIDNSAGGLVTGISYKDNKPNTTPHACSPCIFTGGDDTGFVSGSGTTTLGGAEISWGRWNAGFELKENNTVQTLAGGFHYMYSDSLTTQAQLDALTTARSGSYLYTFTNGSTSLTAPQIETGASGSLVGYGSGAVAPGRVYGGTYVLVNWDSLEIEQVSIKADVNDGTGIRSFNLTEAVDKQGASVKTSLNDVLQGGELTLAGSCSGGQCTVAGNDTTMSGQMTFDLVGSRADGAISSYGASGSSPVNQDITVVGTVLLDSSGPAP